MDRLARAQRGWLARRLWLLGGSAGAAAAAAILQGARLNLDADGAAVHGVALLVTLIIVAILIRLTLLHVDGPSLEDSSWDRHAHRASVREAPFVALCGMMVAALLAVATPGLVADERPPGAPDLAVTHPESDPIPAPVEAVRTPPPPAVESAKPLPVTTMDLAAKHVKEASMSTLALKSMPRGEEISNQRQNLGGLQDGEPPRRFLQDPIAPLQDPDSGRVLQPEPSIVETLPPVRGTVAVFLAAVSGRQEVEGGTGRMSLNLEDVRGTQTFEAAAEITAEFALDASNALRITYAGMQIFEKGELRKDTSFGTATGAKGDPYEFEMVWSHLYAGLQHRLAGYTPDSWFDFSLHMGAMIDHTLARFDSDTSGVSSEAVEGERGWTAPAVGFSTAFWGSGPGGLVLEVLQSLPVNLGGQSIAMTDLRGGFQVEVSESVSVYLGYRHIQAAYRRFDEPLVRTGGRTSSHFEVSGPVIGVDLRF